MGSGDEEREGMGRRGLRKKAEGDEEEGQRGMGRGTERVSGGRGRGTEQELVGDRVPT